MLGVLLVLTCLFFPCKGATGATDCQRLYNGHCIDLFDGSCKAGDRQAMAYCGFMQFCCYPDPSLAIQPTTSTGHERCGTPLVKTTSRIMGGEKVQPGAYPWQVSLRENGIHMCGGSLIDKQWVLTAAHCFEHDQRAVNWTVVMGFHDSYVVYSSQIHRVNRIVIHPLFDPSQNPHDIALVKLMEPVDVKGKYVRTICLPDVSFHLSPGKVCTVTGWGHNQFEGNGSRYMQKIQLPVVSNTKCRQQYHYSLSFITDKMFCAGVLTGGKDSCQGDSGGPYQCTTGGVYVVAGIVSKGYKCGEPGFPGIYTKVSEFLGWIRQNINN